MTQIVDPNLPILYVEDEPNSRLIIKMLSRRMGLEQLVIFEDSNDFAGRVAMLDPVPQLFLLDIHVPPHNGFEMLTMLRADLRYQDAKIVALTASVMGQEVERLRDAGFDGCLGKPIDIDHFPRLLSAIMAGAELWNVMEQ